jgi:hypothetical protein
MSTTPDNDIKSSLRKRLSLTPKAPISSPTPSNLDLDPPCTNKRDHEAFKNLDSEISRFGSKTGVHKANVVRLALLPFLRQQRAEFGNVASVTEASFRIKVLQKWWVSILSTLRDKCHPIANSDRNCYLEAISGLLSRSEWHSPSYVNTTTRYIYESLLYDTIKLAISKLCLKNLPLSLAAFCGKVLAYAFFFAPGVAPVLIHLLRVSQDNIDRVVSTTFNANSELTLNDAINLVKNEFPVHITRLVGHSRGIQPDPNDPNNRLRPKAPPQLPDLYGPWSRRWASTNSDVFIAFLKHYYSIISCLLPNDLPWNAHVASPGLIVIHAFMLGGLDSAVKSESSSTNNPDQDLFNTVAVSPLHATTTPGRKRVDQIKMLSAIREILHNDDNCVPYYESYCRQFERILHAITLRTPLFDVHSCIGLADLVEEYIASLVLDHSLTRPRVQIQKDDAIDWKFWISVVEKMLTSENSSTELRALALLFNLWDHIPISADSNTGQDDDNAADSGDRLEFYMANCEGMKWAVTSWLLSEPMWKKYFCHWQPLVRCYYQRLLCWRIASVGNESELLSSILFSNYNSDSRYLLKTKLLESFIKMKFIVEDSKTNGKPLPTMEAISPVVNRKLAITLNPSSNNNGVGGDSSTTILSPAGTPTLNDYNNGTMTGGASATKSQLRRVNAFDVFDDIAYAYPTSVPPSELFPTEGPGSRGSQETVRKTSQYQQQQQQLQQGQQLKSGAQSPSLPKTEPPSSTSTIMSIGNVIKKRWYRLTGAGPASTPNLKRYSSAHDLTPSPTLSGTATPASLRPSSVYHSGQSSPSFSSLSSSPSFIHTPVSGASSTSTPPSPGSVRSFGSSDSLAAMKKKKKRGNHGTSSTSLIPPPPQLLRQTPEISRPKYRFSLDFCEKSSVRQQEAISRKKKFAKTETVCDLIKPRLPFEFNDPLAYDDDDDDGETEEIIEDVTAVIRQEGGTGCIDMKWKYAGRALTEWASTVAEFEEFVRSRKTLGVSRLEDIGVPFLVAELPAKLKAG